MSGKVDSLLEYPSGEDSLAAYYRSLGIFELVTDGNQVLEMSKRIDPENGTIRVTHSNRLDAYYEKVALKLASVLMLGTANTVAQFPQLSTVLGNNWRSLNSTALDLVIPKSVQDQGREAVAELVQYRIRTAAQVHHSPVLVKSLKQAIWQGFQYKLPYGNLGPEFQILQAQCNEVVEKILNSIVEMDEGNLTLKTTQMLLSPELIADLKSYDTQVLSEATNAILDNLASVFEIVNRSASVHVDDSLNNIVNMFDNRVRIYQYVLDDDPRKFIEA